MLQHVSASLLAKLSISDDNKRAIGGRMGSLVKLMESSKPDGLQEVATNALVSLLSVKSNRKYLVRDEKCVMRLMLLLDPKSEVTSKKFPVAVVAAIMSGRSQSCRKMLMAAGAYGHMRILAEKEVVGAKKALQKLSGNRLKSIFTRTWRESGLHTRGFQLASVAAPLALLSLRLHFCRQDFRFMATWYEVHEEKLRSCLLPIDREVISSFC
ncbi:unnamed protein product [Fraxinus pennsylvanica]|uniref:Uncharacterized protein n=1 Tax=Fraxinus pennsylvanica TaxID=56036 RepID=A0AAD1YU21_9LAMI|nr:unnamed protein product [Fraxinus pennsylvanica]